MDNKKALLMGFIIVLISLASCKKRDENPNPVKPGDTTTKPVDTTVIVKPVDSLTLGYRLKSIESKTSGSENYIYREDGKLTSIISKGKDQVENRWRTYKYDGLNNLVFYSDKKTTGNSIVSYTFEYDETNRFAKAKVFGDLDATDLKTTITYHYDSNQNLDYYLSQNNPSTGISDSITFIDYSNGRPAKQLIYNGTRDPYYSNTYTFSYDSRMNRTASEYKPYSFPYVTGGYNAVFAESINYTGWHNILFPGRFSESLDNPDSQNANNDKDWQTKNTGITTDSHSGYSSTAGNKEYSSILKYNTAGLPRQVQKSIDYFRGPSINDTLNYSYYIYQK